MRCLGCKHIKLIMTKPPASFAIYGCAKLKLRFGLKSDIERGYVNKDAGCVKVPEKCNAK